MILRLLTLFTIVSLVIASEHEHNSKDNDYEEHKSGYGYADELADFSHDNEWLDSSHKHKSDENLFKENQHHQNSNKFADSGSAKHLDEAKERGRDSKSNKYGFFNYHFVEPQYHLEKFYTTEEQAREFDQGKRNHHATRHRDNNQFHAKSSSSNADKLDHSSIGNHGHKESVDEHKNSLDSHNHAYEVSSKDGPFKDGHYIPRFGPY